MASITFIHSQDDHDKNQIRIKRHAAKFRYRKARTDDTLQHHGCKVGVYYRSGLREGISSEMSSSSQQQQRSYFRAQYCLPINIIPPDDLRQIELVLTQASNWMVGKFDSSWGSSVRRDPVVYDFDNGVEIVREAFFLVADLITMGKTGFAFQLLNCLLDIMPDLLKEPHPELFFFLVELAAGINLRAVPTVHARVKAHAASLASIMLGDEHPITILLKCKFGQDSEHVAELVFACILNTLSSTFGPRSYQTLCQQFGRSQFYSSTGRKKLAQHLVSEVKQSWKDVYGLDSALACVADLELYKINNTDEEDQLGWGGTAQHNSSTRSRCWFSRKQI